MPPSRLNTIGSWIGALSGLSVLALFVSNTLSGNVIATHELNAMRDRQTGMVAEIARLQERIDNGPRIDQLREHDRHLSALDARFDATEARMRDTENRVTRVQTLTENIENASNANISRRR